MLAIVLALALVPGAGCSFLLGFDDPVVDPNPDAALVDGRLDAGVDQFEPNDSTDQARDVIAGAYDLSIMPATDNDFFRIVSGGTADVTAVITFSNAEGDLDLRFRNASTMTVLATSAGSTTDSETISLRALPPDTYYLQVYAGERGPTIYHLDLQYTIVSTPDAAPLTDATP